MLIFSSLALALAFSQGTREKRIQPVDTTQRQTFDKQVKVALLVGIGAYPQGSGLGALKYPARDVALLGDELTRQGYLVRRLVDSEASRGVVRRALIELADALDPQQGTFVFYYSGHGFAQDGVNYLATFGATVDDLRSEGLPVTEVESLLAKSKARQRVLWLDACRDDPNSSTRSATQRSFAELNASEGLRVLFSTRAGRVSYENDELHQGLFTHFLVKGLQGEAAGADGLVTFRDLADYVTDSVRAYGVQHGQVQIPYEAGESSGDFLMARAMAAPANSAPINTPAPTPTAIIRPTVNAAPGASLRIQAVHIQISFHHDDTGVMSILSSGIDFHGKRHQFHWGSEQIQEVKAWEPTKYNYQSPVFRVKLKDDKQNYDFLGCGEPGSVCAEDTDQTKLMDPLKLVKDILRILGKQ
jgi:hypothetical protein